MFSTPHDALFKATFRQPDLARSELELVLPADVRAHLDLATLSVCPGSFIDPELQQTHSDLLYAVRTARGGEALVYVLFEHQSSPDAGMAFRFLRYVVRVWERWLEEHRGAKTLPIVLPVLLHHGEGTWASSPELARMIDASPGAARGDAILRAALPLRTRRPDGAGAGAGGAGVAVARSAAAARATGAVGLAVIPATSGRDAVHAHGGREPGARRTGSDAARAGLPVPAGDSAARR